MAKPKNLSPKFDIPNAEKELELQVNQQVMGSRQGGLNLYSESFKRGYGNATFGSDYNGIWLGAADFADALFKVGLDGNAIFRGQGDGTAGIYINAADKTIVVNDGNNDRILIGFGEGLF